MTDSLGEGDTDDIYQFTLAQTTTIGTSLTGMTGDADCYFVSDKNHNGLYDPTQQFDDPANEYLGGSYNTNGADRSFNITLDPGTYFLWVYLQTGTTAATPYTLTLEHDVDHAPPTASLDAPDLTTAQTSLDFAVTYTDNEAMDALSTRYFGAVDIAVHLDNGFDYTTYFYPATAPLNPDFSQDASQITLIYHFAYTDMGGHPIAFGPGDDGTYTVSIHPNVGSDPRPHDVAGNDIPLITLGSFHIEIGSPDTAAPTATATLPPILVPGQATYDFTVAYADGGPFDDSSIDGNDIRVTGPGGFIQLATLVAPPTDSAAGSIHTATYRITAPGGSWGFEDDGPYTVSLLPNQIKDTAGNFAAAQTLGSINVHIPYLGDSNNDDTVGFADLVAVAQNYGAFGKGINSGDINFDGAVDFSDLVLVAQHYGNSLPPPAFPAAPASVLANVAPTVAPLRKQPPLKKSSPTFAIKPIRSTVAKRAKITPVKQPVPPRIIFPSFPLSLIRRIFADDTGRYRCSSAAYFDDAGALDGSSTERRALRMGLGAAFSIAGPSRMVSFT